jgi:hypothetical protein
MSKFDIHVSKNISEQKSMIFWSEWNLRLWLKDFHSPSVCIQYDNVLSRTDVNFEQAV